MGEEFARPCAEADRTPVLVCELLAMSARYPTSLSLSLTELARHGGETGPHVDGWGVAFYEGRDVRMLREPCAASGSPFLELVRRQRIASKIVLCHIRKATQGTTALHDTHPFRRELQGRIHTFAHNGDLPEIEAQPDLALGRYRPVGETDSEYAFCALMARMEGLWSGGTPALSERTACVADFAAKLRALGPANFLYSDGDVLFAHGHARTQSDGERRPPGLHVLCRSCRHDTDELVGLHIDGPRQQAVTLVASVPLSAEGWRPLEAGELLVLRDGAIVPGT
jgi:glutamine amidotransferase